VTAALPGARLGLQVVVRTAVQHYLLGITISKIVRLLREEHAFDVSSGGLVAAWKTLALFFAPDYEEIREAALTRGALHGDETGWRVNGERHWLWTFCTKTEALYLVDRSRGGEVARAVLGEGFGGVLVRDFYAAYDRCAVAETQFCLAHLLREFEKVAAKRGEALGEEFRSFRERTVAVVRDAIRWAKEPPPDPKAREAARARFEARLLKIMEEPREDLDAIRIVDRLYKSAHGLFTFLTNPEVSPTNNWAELNIRPAVVTRKNSYGNRSLKGAESQGVLMSVFRTLELRKENVVDAALVRVKKNIVENHRLKYVPNTGASDG
jgi:hypothetical protein